MELYDIEISLCENFLLSQFNEFGYISQLPIIDPIANSKRNSDTIGLVMLKPSLQYEFDCFSSLKASKCAEESLQERLYNSSCRKRPATNVVSQTVSRKSGLIPPKVCKSRNVSPTKAHPKFLAPPLVEKKCILECLE